MPRAENRDSNHAKYMSKNRTINTKFWDDKYISNLDPTEKLLFIYFLSNPLTDLCGIYEVTLKKIAFDTGFDKEMIQKILDRFSEDGKIFYFDSWIIIKNFVKNQSLNPSVIKGMERSFKMVPQSVWLKIKENPMLGTDWVQAVGSLVHLNLYLYLDLNLDLNLNRTEEQPVAASEVTSLEEVNKKNEVNEILNIFYKINPTINFQNNTQRKTTEELIEKFGKDKIKAMAEYAVKIFGQQYAPTITNPLDLKNKMSNLGAYFQKNQNQTNLILTDPNL